MNARCALLASPIAGAAIPVLRCPTGLYQTHYHGHDPAGPFRPMVPGRPCRHRHQSVNAAVACTAKLDLVKESRP